MSVASQKVQLPGSVPEDGFAVRLPAVEIVRPARSREHLAPNCAFQRGMRWSFRFATIVVSALTVTGMTSAVVGSAPFDGVTPHTYTIGAYVNLKDGGNGTPYLKSGWSKADGAGRYIANNSARLELPSVGKNVRALEIEAFAEVPPSAKLLIVDCLVNGAMVSRLQVGPQGGHVGGTLALPESVLSRHDTLIVDFLVATDEHLEGDKSRRKRELVRLDRVRLTGSAS